jgi:CheY-like chemotaxis protein
MPERYRIIVVEDEPALAELLERLIKRRYPMALVTTFWSGQEALEAYRQQGADLLMVDRGVPGMDGLTMTRMLRQQGDAVPIIGMSGEPAVRDSYLAAGANAFLSGTELFERIDTVLEQLLPKPAPDE